MAFAQHPALSASLLAAALIVLYAEWRREADLARRHVWFGLTLGILIGSGRLYLSRAGMPDVLPGLAVPAVPAVRGWAWQLLGDVLGYGAWAVLGLTLSARAGLAGSVLAEGGGWSAWRAMCRYGLGLGLPLMVIHWAAGRLGLAGSLPALEVGRGMVLLVAVQNALHQETIFRLGLLPLVAWLVGHLPRLSHETIWPPLVGVVLVTILWGMILPGEGALLTALLGLAVGYGFVRAGWEASVLVHILWWLVLLV